MHQQHTKNSQPEQTRDDEGARVATNAPRNHKTLGGCKRRFWVGHYDRRDLISRVQHQGYCQRPAATECVQCGSKWTNNMFSFLHSASCLSPFRSSPRYFWRSASCPILAPFSNLHTCRSVFQYLILSTCLDPMMEVCRERGIMDHARIAPCRSLSRLLF